MALKTECKELNAIKEKYDFLEPDRGDLDDESIKWREGKPDYTKANLAYFNGKSMNHSAGSLEILVENLVKTWEMEASHKVDYNQWKTIDHGNYSLSANGGKKFVGLEAVTSGNYVCLMESCRKDLFHASVETFESSHNLFRGCFTSGFPWELLAVFSGPPKVVFSWRHWGIFEGQYKNRKGDSKIYEMYGICEVMVTDDLKVQGIEVYYKPDEFLEALEGVRSCKQLEKGTSIVGSGCPIMR